MKVSVVIPAYNHERYIAETINSVLSQTYGNYELIIINDGSKDNTEEAALSFKDSRIRYYSQDNQGAHIAINRGIELSTGEYVSILNSDDLYSEDRLECCVDYLDSNMDYSAVITMVSGINGNGMPVSREDSDHIKAWMDWYDDALDYFGNDQFMPNTFSKNILITTSNYFIRREILNDIGGFLPLRYAHDWEMLLRLSARTKIHLIDKSLLMYRFHDSNTVQEDNSEARVKFEVNWLIAENIKYLFSADYDLSKCLTLLQENHYVSPWVLLLILAYNKVNLSHALLDFEHPFTRRLVRLLS